MEPTRVDQSPPLARIGRVRPLSLHLAHAAQPARRAPLEAFIRQRFAEHYGARIEHFMPCLLGLHDAAGQVQGAVGLRSAGDGALFLERYLDQPVEQLMQARLARPVPRRNLVEVGNLAAGGVASARLLILALTDLLAALNVGWVVFTGTPGLLNSFQRLDIPLHPLGLADPARMGPELAAWGSYYDSRPQVMACETPVAHRRLQQQGVYTRLGYTPLYDDGALPHAACS